MIGKRMDMMREKLQTSQYKNEQANGGTVGKQPLKSYINTIMMDRDKADKKDSPKYPNPHR